MLVYRFQGHDGIYKYIRLPRTDLTSLATHENIGFDPPAGALCERPIPPTTSGIRRVARTGYHDKAGLSQPSASTPPPFQHYSSSHLLPFHFDISEYVAMEPPEEPHTEFERWVYNTTKQKNSLLTRIASWLCCVAPPPPPPREPTSPPAPVHETDLGDDTSADVSPVRAEDDEDFSPDPSPRFLPNFHIRNRSELVLRRALILMPLVA